MTNMMVMPWEQGAQDLVAFACAGQDEDAVRALLAVLHAELEPANAIDRMWLRDIALLTVRAEQLRLVQVAAHRFLLRVRARAAADNGHDAAEKAGGGDWAADAGEADAVREMLDGAVPGADPAAAIPVAAFERLLGMTYVQCLATFDQLARLESDVRADRDRVVFRFDNRRRDQLTSAMATAEFTASLATGRPDPGGDDA